MTNDLSSFQVAPPVPMHGVGNGASGDGAVTGAVSDPFLPLRERAISLEVQEERGYIPYYGKHHPLYNPDEMKALLEGYTTMTSGQRNTLLAFMRNARDAKQPTNTFLRFSGDPYVDPRTLDDVAHDGFGVGLVMPKYSFPGEAEILPQLRPEFAVRTGDTTWHRHNRDFLDDGRGLLKHLKAEHGGDLGFPADRLHEHAGYAKYLLTPKAKEDFWHDHETDPAFEGPVGGSKLRAHLNAEKHKETTGTHKHRRNRTGQNALGRGTNRLDILPASFDRLRTAEVVISLAEGTPKADAMESAIRAYSLPWAVCDFPAVGLGKAPELKRVSLRYLQGKLNVLVYDADWINNPKVVRQAFLQRERMRAILDSGAVVVAAPPVYPGQEECACFAPTVTAKGACSECGGYLKGGDDYLAAGGHPESMSVVVREADFPLALFTKPDENGNDTGTIRSSIWGFRELIGVRRDATVIVETLQRYIDHGFLLRPEGKLDITIDEWTGKEEWTGKPSKWPVFTVAPEHRYTEHFESLCDYQWGTIEREVKKLSLFMLELDRDGAHTAISADGVFPDKGAIAHARAKVAETLGCSERQVRDDPLVKLFCEEMQEARDIAVLTLAGSIANTHLARAFGLTPARLSQILNHNKEARAMLEAEVSAVLDDLVDDTQKAAAKAQLARKLMENYPSSPATIAVEKLLAVAATA